MKQATASSCNNNNNSNNSNKGNNSSNVNYYNKPTVACIGSSVEFALAESQPDSSQLAYAHSLAYTAQNTTTVEPVHHITLAQQG